jgi:hypothetical protein
MIAINSSTAHVDLYLVFTLSQRTSQFTGARALIQEGGSRVNRYARPMYSTLSLLPSGRWLPLTL